MFKKFKERWVVLLLALPFAGVGVGLMAFSVIPSVNEWQEMKTWPQAEAQLESAELRIGRGDDSTTYEAIARYTYRYQMQDYSSDRVAIMSGSDNVGNFQQDLASELQSAWRDQQPVPVWINPADPKDAVLNRDMRWNMLTFKLVFALVFGGVGIGLTAFILLVNIDTKNHPQSANKPWLSRREWASDEVSCNTKNALWFIWCFAIIWSLLSLPAALAIPEELASGNNLSLVALLFPLVGIFLFIWAIRSTLSWRRFGQLMLKLDPYPGSIGGQVGGTIELPIVYDSQQSFTTNLFCIRSYETGTDKNRSRSEAVLWQGQGLAHSQPSTGGTRLSICFDVPKDLPESEPASTNYRFWRLELKADLPGVDLQRQFEIPVFATGEKSRAALPLSDQHPQLGAEHEAQIEAVADIEQIPGGVRLYFPMLRSWGGKLIGLVCGVIFAGAAIFMYNETDAPIILVGMFIVFGGGITLTSLKLLFTSLRVQLDHNGLISQRYWLGIPIGRDQIPRADITTLQIATSYKTQSTQGHVEYCKINAVTHSGKKIRIAMNLKGRATAQAALEAIGSLSGYTIH